MECRGGIRKKHEYVWKRDSEDAIMPKTIIPIYDAEKVALQFNVDPTIRIEPWNRQIKNLRMWDDEAENIPDCVAVIEEAEWVSDTPLAHLFRSGFYVLPLIFDRTYFIYQLGDEDSIRARFSTTFSVPHNGREWIRRDRLAEFLSRAVAGYQRHKLGLALGLHYEIEFRTSAADVKILLHFLLLELLSGRFVEPKIKSPLSEEAISSMLDTARQDLIANAYMDPSQPSERCDKFNKVKENLLRGLGEKSSRKMIVELLNEKCRLYVDESFVDELADLRADIGHARGGYGNDQTIEVLRRVRYLNRIVLIEMLLDFDPDFQKFLVPHTFPRFELLKWERF
jgi:hypothetical protein